MFSVIKYWALAGLLVPMIILVITWLQGGVFEWPYLALALWPSSVFYAAADVYLTPDPFRITIALIISIALNVLLYSGIRALVWWLFR